MKVELLYFDGCPNFELLLPRLQGLVDEHAPGNRVELRRVESLREQERFRCRTELEAAVRLAAEPGDVRQRSTAARRGLCGPVADLANEFIPAVFSAPAV